jgi:pimeloyl-ACP methyl ester carboxylesterase
MNHSLVLFWRGLLLAFPFVLAGCSAQALHSPEAPPYSLASPGEHFSRDGRLALVRPQRAHETHIYLLEPYDPARRVVVMLHGLGSSPDVWQPLVAALESDAGLRTYYQLWHVFYPTNVPIPENLRTIRQALLATFAALDPTGTATASQHVTLIGHSMGGVIARLLVVDSGEALWDEFFGRPIGAEERERFAVLEPYLSLARMPQVDDAIFLAAPHRGAPMARDWRGRTAAFVVRLPVNTMRTLSSITNAVATDTPLRADALRRRRNSITTLSDRDDYLRATAALPVAPGVTYHSIIARRDLSGSLATATDGVVPYTSAHLDGAESELVVESRHGVYDKPEAIAEVRRILTENLNAERRLP